MTAARAQLSTARLRLFAPDAAPASSQAEAVADYLQRNRAHFARWDPPQPPDQADAKQVRLKLAEGAEAFASGQTLRWWLALAETPQRVIGSVQLSAVARGAFHSANLGYAIDADCQGRGLMPEALEEVIAEAFSPRLNLHRLQAAVRPENRRSLAVLRRLGFDEIGLARDYLFIDGAWRDHRLFDLRHPGFIRPAGW